VEGVSRELVGSVRIIGWSGRVRIGARLDGGCELELDVPVQVQDAQLNAVALTGSRTVDDRGIAVLRVDLRAICGNFNLKGTLAILLPADLVGVRVEVVSR
jgi:hypothetical protein